MTSFFIDDITEGMILGIDVYDEKGKIIYFKGQVLSNAIIKQFNSIGYMTIDIEENEDQEIPATMSGNARISNNNISYNIDNIRKKNVLCTTAEMLSPKIEKVFKNHSNNPLMQKIKEMALQSISEFWKNNNQ